MPLFTLINRRTGQTLASLVELADTRRTRRRGLLGRESLDPAAALVLTPCCSIHTAFMRFSIDVAFIDRDGGVLRIVHGLPPWRIAVSPSARAVIELAAGSLRSRELLVGDAVYLAPVDDVPGDGESPACSASDSRRMTAPRPACLGS